MFFITLLYQFPILFKWNLSENCLFNMFYAVLVHSSVIQCTCTRFTLFGISLFVTFIETITTLREGRGYLIPGLLSRRCIKSWTRGLPSHWCCKSWNKDGIPSSLPHCGDWLFFPFLSKNVQNRYKIHISRLFGIDVLWRHRWFTSGVGLSHPPGWDNILPDVKYSCL